MHALHLPGVPSDHTPPFRFPDKPPAPSELQYTPSEFPEPQLPPSSSSPSPSYLIRVLTTALTRGELTWAEILERPRFHAHGSAIPGHDVVGIIEKVFRNGSETPKLSIGDRIWGLIDFDRDGAAASYTMVLEHELSLVPPKPLTMPENEWDELLATLPLSGLTAYQGLFTHGNLPTTSLSSSTASNPARVLLTGASGSVGVPAVQLVKAAGFHITAVCSSSSRSFVRDTLHADEIIEYTEPAFISIPESFASRSIPPVDLVIDCIGGSMLKPILLSPTSILKRGGKIVTIVAPLHVYGADVSGQMQAALGKANVEAKFFIVKPAGDELHELGRLVVDGRLQAHVDEVFGLENGRKAMELVESRGRKSGGKVVLRVSNI